MGEIVKNAFGTDPGLELDDPTAKGELAPQKPEAEDQYIEAYDAQGKPVKLKVIFSVTDPETQAAYLYVDQGDDSVMALATKIDSNGNPLQDELEAVDESSPYFKRVNHFLEEYNKGTLDQTKEDEPEEK